MSRFFVYEHWRPDKDVCFYVGKGCVRRHKVTDRPYNRRYSNIVAKLNLLGLEVDVRIINNGMNEADAFTLEMERITLWGDTGELANQTAGGEGISGYSHTDDARDKIRTATAARMAIPEERARIALAHTGMSYGPHSAEHRARIGAAHRGRKDSVKVRARKRAAKLNQPPPTEEAKVKISASVAALWADPQYRQRMSDAHKGHAPSEEARANMRAGQAKRAPRTAEHKARISAAIKQKHAERREAKLANSST